MIKSPLASGKKDFRVVLRDRVQESINRFTEVIKSGKLIGKDLATAYCERSASYSAIGKTEDELRDANEALILAPNSPELFTCRGEVFFQRGDFDKSVADYSKAITLGAINSNSFRGRGVSSYYVGRLEDTAEDLAKASDAADSETRAYIDLWWTYVLQRLGKPLPDSLTKRATDAHGDWPRAALAMLTGKITPEEMLATLGNKSGDDRQMALTEAYFYLGHQIIGDEPKARAFFEKTRELGVIIYTEYITAGFELIRSKGQVEATKKSISR
jgi:lipoprotein NlpI